MKTKFLTALLFVLSLLLTQAAQTLPAKPNIIFILCDDLAPGTSAVSARKN